MSNATGTNLASARPTSPDRREPLRSRFDPAMWQRVYQPAVDTPQYRLFRRIADEVTDAAEPLLRPGQRWLDLGCGTGELSRRLARLGASVIGIDHDPAMILWAREASKKDGNTTYIVGGVENLPCGERSVDGAVAASLTGCLPEPAPFCRELMRVLRPGGRAVLSFTNGRSILLRASVWCRRIPRASGPDSPCAGNFRRYTLDEVLGVLGGAGFRTLRVLSFNCYMDAGRWSFPSRRTAQSLERSRSPWVRNRLCRNYVVAVEAPTRES